MAELGTLEREPALQAVTMSQDEGRRGGGEAAWQRQRHRLAEQGSSLDGAPPEWDLRAGVGGDAQAAQPVSSSADVSTTPPGVAAAPSNDFDPAAAAAAAAALGAADAVAQAPQLSHTVAAAGDPQQIPSAGGAEVPSFIEDALGRRAELDTAAALGSTDMSGGDLVHFSCSCVHATAAIVRVVRSGRDRQAVCTCTTTHHVRGKYFFS